MEKLYNNLVLPDVWPPRRTETTLDRPLAVPYLTDKPDCINISVGRQLFVDDFLIAQTDMKRVFRQPAVSGTPLLRPETPLETNHGYCTCACPFNGGVFYDARDSRFRMWYEAGWFDGTAYAESRDGLHWQRLQELPQGDPEGRVLPRTPGWMRDGDAVWLDPDAPPEERYKMLVFYRCFEQDYRFYHRKPKHAHDDPRSVPPVERTLLYRSPDGVHWTQAGETPHTGDNTTFFYNPFRRKWCFSLRDFSRLDSRVRIRTYYETDDFFAGARWKAEDPVFWSRTDIFDKPDPELGYYTQLYNLDAVAYESVMLGVYSVFMGPPNFVCERTGMPKINDLKLAFSRDGFHFDRGDYSNFIASSRQAGRWDYGYLHPANGLCVVHGEELWFYYSAFSGDSPSFGTHKYSGGAVGLARLRRDGFAEMVCPAEGAFLLTEPLEYTGEYLFVNADASAGELRVELQDVQGHPLPGYEACNCLPVQENSTCRRVCWKDAPVLRDLPPVLRVRFTGKNASLYAFWITDSARGHSHGYLGAGSPDLARGIRDDG